MVARQTLTLFVWVQILVPQPERSDKKDVRQENPLNKRVFTLLTPEKYSLKIVVVFRLFTTVTGFELAKTEEWQISSLFGKPLIEPVSAGSFCIINDFVV